MPPPAIILSPEVQAAQKAGQPLVALESTLISHGLPWPQNLELAREMEANVRATGAVPATIGLVGGQIRVGLDDEALETLATAPDVLKVSRRDLAVAAARGLHGATTVAATILIASWAGIRVMATGGIGGVHRTLDSTPTWDVSADLPELARIPVIVVCAGAKSILDLPATLEWLETWGVPVVGYGTDELPAFYTPTSGLQLEVRADTPDEIATIAHTKWHLGLEGGVLVTVPVPAVDAAPAATIEQAIRSALAEAATQGITGKASTPFLLKRVAELTGGVSLRANLALLRHNATVGGQIAVALGQMPD